jgi:hypothetical protein
MSRIARSRAAGGPGARLVLLAALALAGCNDSGTVIESYEVPNSVAIADMNGDGEADLVVASTRVLYAAPDPGLVSVLLHDAAAPDAFRVAQEVTAGYSPSTLVLGNLDAAGNPDVVVANAGSADVTVLRQDVAAAGSFLPPESVGTGGPALDVATGDLDDDGAPDLVIASFEAGGSAYVAWGDPALPGQFAAPVRLPVNRPVTSVAVGDLDGDGRGDLAVLVQDSSGSNGAVAVLLQDPVVDRQFLPPVSYPAGTEPLAVKIADLNGDARPDLVLVNEGPGLQGQGTAGLSVLLQDSLLPAVFLAPVTYAAGLRPVHMAVGDLNADGRPDLVVADRGGYRGAVKVLLQDPVAAGVFLGAASYPGFYGPLGVAIGDLNGDGLPDIAAADGVRATVLYQEAGSPGQFAAAVPVGN